jgi:hypothetical protein
MKPSMKPGMRVLLTSPPRAILRNGHEELPTGLRTKGFYRREC